MQCKAQGGQIKNMKKEMFIVKRNDDAKRFEFNPTGNWIGYTVAFNECDANEENAWICVCRAYQQLKIRHYNEQKADSQQVNKSIAKPSVVCRFEECMSQLGEAHNLLAKTNLSKKEYEPISGLLAKAKVELFKIYYGFKNEEI